MSDRKIINDPVFGFINIPKGLLYDIVCHPLLQRLTRIKQLGLSSAVYPGAQHTRFQHSLGAFHLMSETIKHLTAKGNFIFDSEAEAVQAAILLHDIGHGPFSHVLENTLAGGVSHEEISLMLMERMNKDMKGQLNLAIQIFKDEYPKKFLHQLVSGQLDMDRLDYLRRDSFYTGVSEGNIGSARIIKMLDVKDDHLVVESKGIYSIENFLMSRRHAVDKIFRVQCAQRNFISRAALAPVSGHADAVYKGLVRLRIVHLVCAPDAAGHSQLRDRRQCRQTVPLRQRTAFQKRGKALLMAGYLTAGYLIRIHAGDTPSDHRVRNRGIFLVRRDIRRADHMEHISFRTRFIKPCGRHIARFMQTDRRRGLMEQVCVAGGIHGTAHGNRETPVLILHDDMGQPAAAAQNLTDHQLPIRYRH